LAQGERFLCKQYSGVVWWDVTAKLTSPSALKQVKKRQPNQYPGEALSPSYSGGDAASTFHTPRAFHVSNLRLEVESEGKAYVATRIRRSAVSWDRKQRRFSWKRWGLVTELAEGESKGWVAIPWPQEEVPTVNAGGEFRLLALGPSRTSS
jgi:hypothetical protein